jgi:hypothetical protein
MQLAVLPQRAFLRRGRIELVCDAPVDERHGLVDTLSQMSEQAEYSNLYRCAYALHYHLVMCTKYRRKCIDAEMLNRFKEIAEARCRGWRSAQTQRAG